MHIAFEQQQQALAPDLELKTSALRSYGMIDMALALQVVFP
jgi:hypothetical protein